MQELGFFEEQKNLSSYEPGLGNLHRLTWEWSISTALFRNRDLVDGGSILQRYVFRYHPCVPPAVFSAGGARSPWPGRAVPSDMRTLILTTQPTRGSPARKLLSMQCSLWGFCRGIACCRQLSLRFYWLKSSSVLSIQAINDLTVAIRSAKSVTCKCRTLQFQMLLMVV